MPPSHEPDTRNGRRRDRRDPLPGTWLDDRFLIERRIATGGFGAIYRGRTADGTPVAVKVLHPSLIDDPSMVARFRREGATLTQLHDRHTVTTLAVGETGDGTLYIAMELLSGESLHDRLRRDRVLPWQAVIAIARAVCSSLAEAHALGIVHRDLKPDNIHVASRGGGELIKVIDFGIVKIARGSAIDDGEELTCAGHTIGTYEYMSPEQIAGAPCHGASDIYSLGVVIYEMLTGRRPFARASTPAAVMTALLTQTPQAPSVHTAIPPALDRIVMRCLERDPQHRFASTVELGDALLRVLAQQPTWREEVTAPHRVWDPTASDPAYLVKRGGDAVACNDLGAAFDDECTWIDPDGSPPTCELPTGPEGAGMAPIERTVAPAPRSSQLALGTGPVPRTSGVAARPTSVPRNLPAAPVSPPAVPLFTTLPGMAVATERPSRPGFASRGPATALPMRWQTTPAPRPSIPPPCIRREPLASGSVQALPARTSGMLWIAIGVTVLAAIAVAMMLI